MTDTTNLADRLEAFIPRGDGYNSDYANTLTEAVEALRSAQSARVPDGYFELLKDIADEIRSAYAMSDSGKRFLTRIEAMLAEAPKPPVQEPVGFDEAWNSGLFPLAFMEDRELCLSVWNACAKQPSDDVAKDALVEALNELLHQIDINDFIDSHGHSAKMLKAVHEGMKLVIAYRAAMAGVGNEHDN